MLRVLAALGVLMTLSTTGVSGQGMPTSAGSATAVSVDEDTPLAAGAVRLLVGRSTLLNMSTPIARVSLTTPEVADALVTSSQQLLLHGKAPGTISLVVWDEAGRTSSYEVAVQRDLSVLRDQFEQLFPGEPIGVSSSGTDIVLSGTVSSKYVVDHAADVAAGHVETDDNIVNLLQQADALESTQVMLRVRFAEVGRSALSELGASFFTGPGGY